MKKALVLFSICTAISPVIFAETPSNADTKGGMPVVNSDAVVQVTPADAAVIDDGRYPWLKNVSGNLAFVTNYIFRGISQTRNLPAIQGGLTYTFPINVYLNLWGSNVQFFDSHGAAATVEFDTIIGYRNTYGDNFAYDLNFGRYNYPGARHANYNELNTVFNYYFLQVGLGYSANVFNTHSSGTYYLGGINYDIPSTWVYGVTDLNLLATIGHYSLPVAAGNSYNDYNIQLSKAFKNYRIAGQWTSTNGRQHNSPIDGSQLIATLAADF